MEIKRETLKYYDNAPGHGYIIDWPAVFKLYHGLGCPKHVFDPSTVPIEDAAWFVLTSERNTGKTTNLVLIAMLLWAIYGAVTAYIRQSEDMITPKEMQNFMNVILEHGYIQKITNGEYNGVRYRAHNYRFVKWDLEGKAEKESDPFIWCGAVRSHEDYKSILNLPTCNLIIFDEFISSTYAPNEFIMLSDLHKTIGRNRHGLKIFMLANTTYYYNEYFRDMMIQDEVINCKVNHSFIKVTPLGTRVFYKMLGDKDMQREKINTEYYGFDNPLLKSITGGDWAVNNYPHITPQEEEKREFIDGSRYIKFNSQYYRIELVTSERLGLHCVVHRATSAKYAEVVFTVEEIREKRERFRYGFSKIDKYLWALYIDNNKWYFADNECGYAVEAYCKRCDSL